MLASTQPLTDHFGMNAAREEEGGVRVRDLSGQPAATAPGTRRESPWRLRLRPVARRCHRNGLVIARSSKLSRPLLFIAGIKAQVKGRLAW
jgi:hypothetical protein